MEVIMELENKTICSFDCDESYIENKRWDILSRGVERLLEDLIKQGLLSSDINKVKSGIDDGRFFMSFCSPQTTFSGTCKKEYEIGG
jgi:hypothetical protein